MIRKLERNDRDSASLPTLRKLASALDVTTVHLFEPRPAFAGRIDNDDRSDLYSIRRVLQPARSLGPAVTLADDDEAPTPDEVGRTSREIAGMFRDSDYACAVAALPTAITHARSAVSALDSDERVSVLSHLAQIYQTAAMVLIQLRKDDLAWQALGESIAAGQQADDPVLIASAINCENWLLTRQGRFDDAERAALDTAEKVEPSFSRSPKAHVAIWGWLNLGAAAAATRNNRSDTADEALRRARAAAHVSAGYTSPQIEHWTSFDPGVVAMREVELAMVQGDVGRALRSARHVPPGATPAVTHQRFRLDVAAAQVERRRDDDAVAILVQLRKSVPGWLRYQRYARNTTKQILCRRSRAISPELRDLADFLEIDS